MDKYDFMSVVDDILEECKSKEEMDSRLKEMREILRQMYMMKIIHKKTFGYD